MEYVVIFYCYSGTGDITERNMVEKNKIIKTIKIGAGGSKTLGQGLKKLLDELNKGRKDYFWLPHQVIPPQSENTE